MSLYVYWEAQCQDNLQTLASYERWC